MRRLLITLIFSWVVCLQMACTANYTRHIWNNSLASVNLADSHYHQRSAEWVIHPTTTMCVAKPANWDHGARRRALLELQDSVISHFQQAFPHLVTIDGVATRQQLMQEARIQRCELVVLPMLVNVENHLNTRQEINIGPSLQNNKKTRPDEVAVTIQIFETRSGKLLDVATLASRQRLFAANDTVATDLFGEAIRRYLRSLTGGRSTS